MIQPQYFQPTYPQAPSAVSINIYEPKSYGSAPSQAPYGYTNQLYEMPQSSAWAPQSNYAQSPYQQYAMNPVQVPQYAPVQQMQPVNVSPVAPQPMPQSAMEPQIQQEPTGATQQAEQAQTTEQTQMPEVGQPQESPKVNTDALLADLKSPNFQAQGDAITSIANFTQSTPDIALQVVTDPIKQGLIDIIKSDTSALPDLTEEQKAISAKKDKGEKLTPEEEATLAKESPKLEAEKNKVFALFTLAMVQKLSRDNEAQYAQYQTEQGKQAPAQLGLKDLMGYNEITNIIQNEPNGQLKTAAIQALQYMAKPEEKAEVEQILTPVLNDQDPMVKQAAQDAIAKLGGALAENTQPQQ